MGGKREGNRWRKKLTYVNTPQRARLEMSMHVWRYKVKISMTFANAKKETGQCNYDKNPHRDDA